MNKKPAHCYRPKILLSTINSVINQISQYSRELSAGLCEFLFTFFVDKVSDIRLSFTKQLSDLSLNLPTSPFLFCHFQHVSLMELSDLVNKMKTTNSSLDIVPPEIIKADFPVIGPSGQVLVNSFLDTGVVPNCSKHVVVQPLLKKQGLDEGCFNNLRPVSKLSFLSKLLEKVVQLQLITFLNTANLLEPLQSGFTAFHWSLLCLKCSIIFWFQ